MRFGLRSGEEGRDGNAYDAGLEMLVRVWVFVLCFYFMSGAYLV